MFKFIFTIFSLFSIILSLNAQTELDNILNQKAPNCYDIYFNSTNLIPNYYHKGELDSVNMVLEYWEGNCGESEAIMRLKILLAIENGDFSESLYGQKIIYYILNYSEKVDVQNRYSVSIYNNYQSQYYAVFNDYDKFTTELAQKLKDKQPDNSLEHFYCELYSNNLENPFKDLEENSEDDNSNVQRYYDNAVWKYINMPDFHFSGIAGIWIPTENLELLGNHPILGMKLGMIKKRMTYNITLSFKFSESKDEYIILTDDIIDTTRHFSGGYIGFDVERALLKTQKHEIDLLAGIGYDYWSALKSNKTDNNPDNDRTHTIGSLNLNIGIGYKYFIQRNWFVALQGRYNYVDYSNRGGTNLSGNTITVSFITGGLFTTNKTYNLKSLKYYD